MARASFNASAPGNLMLLGEHAVLHGKRALVCAVDRRIHVTLTPRLDGRVTVTSTLGRFCGSLDHIRPAAPFAFVTALIARWRSRVKDGFDLKIRSDFSDKVGLGSSAAVTVATGAAIMKWLDGRVDRKRLFAECRAVIRAVQGLGSGADVAASVFGGIVAYRAKPLEIRKLGRTHPITVIYSGSKKPTPEVVRLVQAGRRRHPRLFRSIYELMDLSSDVAVWAVDRGLWPALGELLNINQGLMETIGVSNARLSRIARALRADPNILGAKISGSGLGDCVVGLGKMRRSKMPFLRLPATMSADGVV